MKTHKAQNEWQEATDNWVKLTLEKYCKRNVDDLTQVFMRGPFAGWSEYMVLELAMKLDDSNNKLPRHKAQQGANIMKVSKESMKKKFKKS